MEKIIDRPGAPPGPDDDGWVNEVSAYLATPDTPGIVDDIDPAPKERVPEASARRLGDGAVQGVGVSGNVGAGRYYNTAYEPEDPGAEIRGLNRNPDAHTQWHQPRRYSDSDRPRVLGHEALGPQLGLGSHWRALNNWQGWQEPGRF